MEKTANTRLHRERIIYQLGMCYTFISTSLFFSFFYHPKLSIWSVILATTIIHLPILLIIKYEKLTIRKLNLYTVLSFNLGIIMILNTLIIGYNVAFVLFAWAIMALPAIIILNVIVNIAKYIKNKQGISDADI